MKAAKASAVRPVETVEDARLFFEDAKTSDRAVNGRQTEPTVPRDGRKLFTNDTAALSFKAARNRTFQLDPGDLGFVHHDRH